jgi:hypothetical protein
MAAPARAAMRVSLDVLLMNASPELVRLRAKLCFAPDFLGSLPPNGLFVVIVQREVGPVDGDVPEPLLADFVAVLQANGTL